MFVHSPISDFLMEMTKKICIHMYTDTISMVSTLCVSMCVLINERLCRSSIFLLHSKLKKTKPVFS